MFNCNCLTIVVAEMNSLVEGSQKIFGTVLLSQKNWPALEYSVFCNSFQICFLAIIHALIHLSDSISYRRWVYDGELAKCINVAQWMTSEEIQCADYFFNDNCVVLQTTREQKKFTTVVEEILSPSAFWARLARAKGGLCNHKLSAFCCLLLLSSSSLSLSVGCFFTHI